jgi:hypothetical protein
VDQKKLFSRQMFSDFVHKGDRLFVVCDGHLLLLLKVIHLDFFQLEGIFGHFV